MELYFEIWLEGHSTPCYANVKKGLVECTKEDGAFYVEEIGDDYVVFSCEKGEVGASYGTFGSTDPLASNGRVGKTVHIDEYADYFSSWEYNGNKHKNGCKIYLRRISPIEKPVWSLLVIDTPEGEHIEYTREQCENKEMHENRRLEYEGYVVGDDFLRLYWEEEDDDREGPYTTTESWSICTGESCEWCGCHLQLVEGNTVKLYQFDPETEDMKFIGYK